MVDWAAMLIGLSYGPAVLLKATALLACAWCVHEALRGRNPRWRVLLWRATLVALAVLPIAEWALPRLEIAVAEQTAPFSPSVPAATEPLMAPQESFAPVDTSMSVIALGQIETVRPPFDIKVWMADHSAAMVGAVWVLVSFLLLLGIARAWRNVRTAVKRSAAAPADVCALAERVARELGVVTRINVRITEQPGSPFLTGIRHPVIVLPARCLQESDTQQLRAVLAHELAHVMTWDPVWMAFARLMASLLWFHPLMWRVRSAHNSACEDVSDSVAAAYLGSPDTYSKALAREALALLDAQPVSGGVPMLRSAEIVHRLRKIRRGVRANPLARRWVAASLLVAAGLLVTLGSLKLVHARPAEDGMSDSESHRTSDDTSENRIAAAKSDWVLPSIEIGLAGEEPVANVPGLQVELLGVVGNEPTLIAADGRGVEPDVWGTRVEDAIRTHWEDVRERRFGATENGTNVGLLFRLRPENQSLREYELVDAVLNRGDYSSSAVYTVGGPVGNMAEDRVQIMQIRSDQALELPDHMDVTATVSYGPPLDTYVDIPVDAESAAIEMKEWKFTATVRKLPDTRPDDEIPHEERPEVALTFSAGGPLVNYRVVAIDQQGNPIEPYADPHLDDLRHGHDYTWKFGFPEPISKQSIQGFRLVGYPLQPITWKNVPFVTRIGARSTDEANTDSIELSAFPPILDGSSVATTNIQSQDPMSTPEVDKAIEDIQARYEDLCSRKLRITYTRRYEGNANTPPSVHRCVLLAHEGNYREMATDQYGRQVDRYFFDGLRADVGEEWQSADGSIHYAMDLPPIDDADVVSMGKRIDYHPYNFLNHVDGDLVYQWSIGVLSFFEQARKQGRVRRSKTTDGLDCVLIGQPGNETAFAPELEWAWIGNGPLENDEGIHSFTARSASDFVKQDGLLFPRIIRNPLYEVQVTGVDASSAFDSELLRPPSPEDGWAVVLWCPQWKENDADNAWIRAEQITWKTPLPLQDLLIYEIARSQWRLQEFADVVRTNFPQPFYDEEKNTVVWASKLQHSDGYEIAYEGFPLPERFGTPPWNSGS